MKASREIDASRWIQWDGLTDNQSDGEGRSEEGVFDPDSRVGAVAQLG